MMTGAQYRAPLDDGRSIFFEGERVKDLCGHSILGPAVDVVARCYDRFHSTAPGAQSPLMAVARSAADLKARLPLLNTSYAPRHAETRDFPISARNSCPEGFVILDDVFVPSARVFLDGEAQHAGVFAHPLGLWERLGGRSVLIEEADQLVGFAQLIAEANGLAAVAHIREKISEMIIHATLVRAALEAAISNCGFGPDGAAYPDELFTNAGKYLGAANYNQMVRHLHDIAGGSVLTAPAIADLENSQVGPLVRK
jgi:4-hydroxybutyryl-CoA dehydratase/vinylacetyl-CoA-Delta-isomerase